MSASGNIAPVIGFQRRTGQFVKSLGSSGDAPSAIVVQAEGKILVAGDNGYNFLLMRLTSDGSLDPSFNKVGTLALQVGNLYNNAYSVLVQPDNKIVVAGASNDGSGIQDFSLVRLNSDGSLDSSFGTGGKLLQPVGQGYDHARGVALLPNGKLIVAGYSHFRYTEIGDISLVRLNDNGSLDT
nr:delta-60 repeat domain-containing protein [Rhodoferax sp.]